MTGLGIYPAQSEWLKAVVRGEKVLWHSSMHLLACFAPDFDPASEQYIAYNITPEHFHDLLYPLSGGREKVVGVQFWCLGGVLTKTDILGTQDAAGSLAPQAIFERGTKWYESTGKSATLTRERKEEMEKRNALGLAFLRSYPLTVPSTLWMQALPRRAA